MTAEQATRIVQDAIEFGYSRWRFEDFCEVIGEPTEYNGFLNNYALDKFDSFKRMVDAMSNLGSFFPKIVVVADRKKTEAGV